MNHEHNKHNNGRGSAEVRDTPAGRIFVPSPNTPLLAEYMSEAEFAAEIGRTVRTVARWRSLGEGPPVTKIGRQNYYRRDSTRAWMESLERDA
jgi:hypothetical protein